MALTKAEDGNITKYILTDDGGADLNQSITFPFPAEIVRVKVEKPPAGTLTIQHVESSGPAIILGSASLSASDTSYYKDSSDLLVSGESLLVQSTGAGAGVKVSISAQNLNSEQGRDY